MVGARSCSTLAETSAGTRWWMLSLDDDVVTPLLIGQEARNTRFAPGEKSLLVTEFVDSVPHVFETSFDGKRKRELTFGGASRRRVA